MGKRVLLVDDGNRSITDVTARVLEQGGHEAIVYRGHDYRGYQADAVLYVALDFERGPASLPSLRESYPSAVIVVFSPEVFTGRYSDAIRNSGARTLSMPAENDQIVHALD